MAGESILGRKEETYQSAAMTRGIELEPEARGYYELVKGVEVEQVGLCYPDERQRYSCSPDGLIGENGLLEMKCPILHTHVEYLLKGNLDIAFAFKHNSRGIPVKYMPLSSEEMLERAIKRLEPAMKAKGSVNFTLGGLVRSVTLSQDNKKAITRIINSKATPEQKIRRIGAYIDHWGSSRGVKAYKEYVLGP